MTGSTTPADFASRVEAVRCIYDAYESGDFRTPGKYFTDDVQGYVSEFVPWGGFSRGVRELRQKLQTMRSYVSLSFEATEYLDGGGDCVVAVGLVSGLVHATYEPFSVNAVHLWHFRDGEVAGFEYYLDEALGQLFRQAA